MEDRIENKHKYVSNLFVIICSLFVVCLLLSNLIASKIICIANVSLPAAVILFPITYIFSDIFTEVYGFRKSKMIIWIGFACNTFAVLVYMITIFLPYPDFWTDQEAFVAVLGTTPRVLIASLFGYLFGEFANSIILSKLKVKMAGKNLWFRTIFSTIIGEALDTVIFILISFGGLIAGNVIFQMVLFQYLWKVCYEIVLTPATYVTVKWLKKKENVDVYDFETVYRVLGPIRSKGI